MTRAILLQNWRHAEFVITYTYSVNFKFKTGLHERCHSRVVSYKLVGSLQTGQVLPQTSTD